jgi:hypothetical protein
MTKRSPFRMQLFASALRDGARTQTCRALATGSEKLQRLRHFLYRFGPANNRLERESQIIIGYTETENIATGLRVCAVQDTIGEVLHFTAEMIRVLEGLSFPVLAKDKRLLDRLAKHV